MHISRKIMIILSIFIMGMSSHCSAKLIYDTTGRISFETSDHWFYAPGEGDLMTYHLHSIALNKDTAIILKQSKYPLKYESMENIPTTEKSILRDSILKYHISALQEKGYVVTINKTDCLNDSIIVGLTVRKNDIIGRFVIAYYIKDYAAVSLCFMGTDETIREVVNTVATLKIDGIPFSEWISE